jgi:hypothetical protein
LGRQVALGERESLNCGGMARSGRTHRVRGGRVPLPGLLADRLVVVVKLL